MGEWGVIITRLGYCNLSIDDARRPPACVMYSLDDAIWTSETPSRVTIIDTGVTAVMKAIVLSANPQWLLKRP